MNRKLLTMVGLLLGLMLLGIAGCSDLGYYLQCARGQLEIAAKRRPIAKVLDDPKVSISTKHQLEKAREIRRFATKALGLPNNDSYYEYADLGRDFVLWNVVATPEFSLKPITWCFPIAGCVPYRGYYAKKDAEAFANGLRQQGNDVWVYGVPAYSTLNWFSDPILNTFSHYRETALAGLIFHELAHQQVYLPGHADFNEAFAETVEHEGVLRWLEAHGTSTQKSNYQQQLKYEDWFLQQTATTRARLQKLYATRTETKIMRAEKRKILGQFQNTLRDFLQQRHLTGFNAWLTPDLNNARFASLSTYRRLEPAFENLLALEKGSLPRFYKEVTRIAGLGEVQRVAVLDYLTSRTTKRVVPKPTVSALLQTPDSGFSR